MYYFNKNAEFSHTDEHARSDQVNGVEEWFASHRYSKNHVDIELGAAAARVQLLVEARLDQQHIPLGITAR